MILRTNIEPTSREAAFGMTPGAIRTSRMEPHIQFPKIGERWLVVFGSQE